MSQKITVQTGINASIEKVWECFTNPDHVTKWNNASEDWHSPRAENNLTVGGTFNYRMEAKDGSSGFDFEGTYEEIIPHQKIVYTMIGDDKRTVEELFEERENKTHVTIIFDAEETNPIEMQRGGWQSILDNFKRHVEQE